MRQIRAGIAHINNESYKVRRYNKRRKEGLCVECGDPAATTDDVSVVRLRGELVVQRGEVKARCNGCSDRHNTRVTQRKLNRCRG